MKMTPQAIDWPSITVGGQSFTLRYSYAANYQLARWGRTLADANSIELAASMAGTFDSTGRWRSAGFERALDLADMLDPSDEPLIIVAVTDAIKKAYPELEVSARQTPETKAPASQNES
jgi:hypothetical protein